jgi:hypothetical protein
MAASLNAAPVGEDEAGRAGVLVAPDTVGLQKPITLEVPNPDPTGPVSPSGVIAAFANADGAAGSIDEDPATGDSGTGAVVTGNVANGDMIGEEADGDVVNEIAGQVDPAALAPLIGHVVMLPKAAVCDWPRLPP